MLHKLLKGGIAAASIIAIVSFAWMLMLRQSIIKRRQSEEAQQKLAYDLGERVKELNCLYGISKLRENPDILFEEMIQGIADLIPPSWQYPEAACARIIVEDKEYRTNNFKETQWKQISPIVADGKSIGRVEICYLSEKPEKDEGPFLQEERSLIDAITERLGRVIERQRADENKKTLEARLRQAQKMEAIAKLSGGIAHEFNNALYAISGNIELLEMDLAGDDKITAYMEPVKVSTRRMTNLTDPLLAYARGGKYQPKNISLNDFVEDTLPLVKHDIDPAINVQTYLQDDIYHVEADLTQMQMVMSAIVTNAAEAIEGEGQIRIKTSNEELDEEFVKQHFSLKPGPHVCLTIEDDGKGMGMEARQRIFEPFYTTKFQGRGLGMAAVYGIVQNHKGWISVYSEEGNGTVVRIYLQAVEDKTDRTKEPKIGLRMGVGTVLVVEDEEIVMDVSRAMLERLGYSVLEAASGKEAIDIVKTFDGDIDLVLLDIKLPDMEGGRIYDHIKEIRPNLKVVVCSGYSIDGPAQEILNAGAQAFLQKPFSIQTLSKSLSEVLGDELT